MLTENDNLMKIIELHCYQPVYMPNGKMLNKIGINDNQIEKIIMIDGGFLIIADWKAKRVLSYAGKKEEVICNVFVPCANVRNAVYTDDKEDEEIMEQFSPVKKVEAEDNKRKIIDKEYAVELKQYKLKLLAIRKTELRKLAKAKGLFLKQGIVSSEIVDLLLEEKCKFDGYNHRLLKEIKL